jgi:ferritin-like metal-binding protein YciE
MNDTTNANVRYDSGVAHRPDNDRHSIQTYVSDMLALERHIREPLARQYDDKALSQFAGANDIVATLKAMTDAHIISLDAHLKSLGGHEASEVKSAWATLLGVGAAAVDSIRKTRVSKNLRDDYTALSLAAVSYTMLHTTALALGDDATARLAERHLDDITPFIREIGRAIPRIVLQELAVDGERVDMSVVSIAESTVERSWQPSNRF